MSASVAVWYTRTARARREDARQQATSKTNVHESRNGASATTGGAALHVRRKAAPSSIVTNGRTCVEKRGHSALSRSGAVERACFIFAVLPVEEAEDEVAASAISSQQKAECLGSAPRSRHSHAATPRLRPEQLAPHLPPDPAEECDIDNTTGCGGVSSRTRQRDIAEVGKTHMDGQKKKREKKREGKREGKRKEKVYSLCSCVFCCVLVSTARPRLSHVGSRPLRPPHPKPTSPEEVLRRRLLHLTLRDHSRRRMRDGGKTIT